MNQILKSRGVQLPLLLVVLYCAVYAATEPPPTHFLKQFAQVSAAAGTSQPCLNGYEYQIDIGAGGNVRIRVVTKPVANADPTTLPLGIVHYVDMQGRHRLAPCKKGAGIWNSIAQSPKVPHIDALLRGSDSGISSSYPSDGGYYVSPSDPSVVGGTTNSNPNHDPTQLFSNPISPAIEGGAQTNESIYLSSKGSPPILCYQQGSCGEVGIIETNYSPPVVQEPVPAQSGVESGNLALGRPSIQFAGAPPEGEITYYDPDTGKPFLHRAPNDLQPTLIAEGKVFSTAGPIAGWEEAMRTTLDTPTKFIAFESEYFDNGSKPTSFTLTEPVSATDQDMQEAIVTATDSAGNEKSVPRVAYDAVQWHGEITHGAIETYQRVYDATGGKVTMGSSIWFPQETGTEIYKNPGALTPLTSGDHVSALRAIEQEVQKYPPEYWQNANRVLVTTYGYTPSAENRAVANGKIIGGHSGSGEIWLNGSHLNSSSKIYSPTDYSSLVHHEFGHNNEVRLFGSDERWATEVYGPQYGSAYAGKSGYDAQVSGKFERPEGFARDYGHLGGIKEDQATVVESMFTNYSAVKRATATDPTLAAKVALVKTGYANMSNGAMDDAYWLNLKPIDPNFVLPPTPTPGFFQRLFNVFSSAR